MGIYDKLEQLNANRYTENGDLAYSTTSDNNLDLFSTMGSSRHLDPIYLQRLFINSYQESRLIALANLLYLRDIREGHGERQSFRSIVSIIDKNSGYNQEMAQRLALDIAHLIPVIVELGRWDDIVEIALHDSIAQQPAIDVIKEQLNSDIKNEHPSLLAKWLPSENASSKQTIQKAKLIRKQLDLSSVKYRKLLSHLRQKINIVENHLRTQDYHRIDYSHVPSKAMNKYHFAFYNNDGIRFIEYLEQVKKGKAKINVGTLHPHEITSKFNHYVESEESNDLIREQWKALKRVQTNKKTIVVRDGSASMIGLPMNVGDALTILFSEQLDGAFKDSFITFSSSPEIVRFNENDDIIDKLKILENYDDIANTNIEKVYELIFNVLKDEPETSIDSIVIISDMEFDMGTDNVPTYELLKRNFNKIGRDVPHIVYWNVDSRQVSFPVSKHENVKLVSGYSNSILQSILNSNTLTPVGFMLETLSHHLDLVKQHV